MREPGRLLGHINALLLNSRLQSALGQKKAPVRKNRG
jgi:hypothetical protein